MAFMFDLPVFRPEAWYWIVAGDETRWWSSASAAYVAPVQLWLDAGNLPTRIANEAELSDVLSTYKLKGPLPPSATDIDAERDRRRNLPISITTSPTGTFQINMDDISQQNIAGLATAGIVLSNAAPTQTTAFRDIANVTHSLLPSELVSMGLQVMAHIGALYAKSWALKAMSPIPADYAADSHWS
jgi:hypothetical protein